MSGIYTIINYAERKFYVGSSINVKSRLTGHRQKLMRGRHHSKTLQKDFDRLGRGAFLFTVLESGVDLIHLHERENFWMDALGGLDCYNSVRAHARRDERYHNREFAKTSCGTIWVGQPVMFRRRQAEVTSISERLSSYYIRMDSDVGGHFVFGPEVNDIVPMDID